MNQSRLDLVYVIQSSDGITHNDCVAVCADEETAKAYVEEHQRYSGPMVDVEIVKKAVLRATVKSP